MHTRTAQQEAIVENFRSGRGDTAVIARAGTGKSFTILQGIGARRGGTATLCAFNKRIAVELTEKLRGVPFGFGVQAKTLHGIGFRAVQRWASRRIDVDKRREFKIARDILGTDSDDECEDVAAIAALAKEISPDNLTADRLAEIAIDFGFAGDDEDDDTIADAVARAHVRAKTAITVIDRSLDVSYEISFADMVWLPLALKLQPDQSDIVCVDEAQDMNLSQLRLAARVRKQGGRIVVVGDPRQAIYSWRGAAPGALERVADALDATRLSLTVTFRCARSIVDAARAIVPDIEAAPGAPDGIVRETTEAELVAKAEPGDFVLSRTNAPLTRICLRLIRAGKRAQIVGSDIGPALIKLVHKLARHATGGDPIGALLVRLGAWREREVARAIAAGRQERADFVADQADALTALAEDADDVNQLIGTIERIFADDGGPRVACSTIHRAKGLEADRTWILASTLEQMRPRTPIEQVEEANLRYVAITRARRELVWVNP